MSSGNVMRTGFETLIGHVSTAEFPEDEPISQTAHRLTPIQRSFVALRVRGFSSAAACRQLNVNIMAGSRWSNSDWFEPACEEERNKWLISAGVDKKQEIVAPLVGAAMDALKTALASEDEKIRLMAANQVFDMFFDVKKPGPGRPRKEVQEEDSPLDLSDIQQRAKNKITLLNATNDGQIDLRANA